MRLKVLLVKWNNSGSTATLNFCGSNKVFLPKSTQSYQMGAFQYIRKKRIKDLHPLWSVSAYGKHNT